MTDELHDLTWLATGDLRGLAGLFDSFARMEGTNAAAVAWWGEQAWVAVNAELLARTGGDPSTDTLPSIEGLTDTELCFIAQGFNGVRLAGGEGLRQWVERVADHIVDEMADRAARRLEGS
ncbi:hypothetical protein [Mycobacterium sp.]|uniref:hypothetical protein n=1 Tax=Mycobacterium sp. TaxID=1785 RepID=UPI003F959736